jgi:PTH1 family peptidyl-tRNA hydrolase
LFFRRKDEPVDWLIIGIGNPGRQYADTRHNLGFRVVNELARRWGVGRMARRFQGLFGVAEVFGERVGLLKPMTFVNRSGQSVAEAVRQLRLPTQRLLVVLDDAALPLGKLRLRSRGSDGGHKGLRSILEALGTQFVPRLRIGIGAPPPDTDLVTFVLSPFAPEERPIIEQAIERAADAVQVWMTEGVEAAMQQFNR